VSWQTAAASVVGSSHLDQGKPCQDAFALQVLPLLCGGEALCAVVSDGAGSAEHSEQGSRLACDTAMDLLTSRDPSGEDMCLTEQLAHHILDRIREELASEAQRTEVPLKSFACTLLGTLITPEQALYFQVGDGALVVQAESVAGVVFWPEEGLYANMTHFVTGEDAADHLEVYLSDRPPTQLALFSDGLQRLALNMKHQTIHRPFFDPMWKTLASPVPDDPEAWNRGLVGFLGSEAVKERTDDDKTLVLANRVACRNS